MIGLKSHDIAVGVSKIAQDVLKGLCKQVMNEKSSLHLTLTYLLTSYLLCTGYANSPGLIILHDSRESAAQVLCS